MRRRDGPAARKSSNWEDKTDIITYPSILHHNIKLTAMKRLKAGDFRMINHALTLNQ